MRISTLLRISVLSIAILASSVYAQPIDVLPIMSGDELVRLDLERDGEFEDEDLGGAKIPKLEVVFEKAVFDTATFELAIKGCVILPDSDAQTRRAGSIWIQAGELRTYYKAIKTEGDTRLHDDGENNPAPDYSSSHVLKTRQFIESGPDGCFEVEIKVQDASDHMWFLAPQVQTDPGGGVASSSLYAIGLLLDPGRFIEDQLR